jgi:peroxiredoxin family protein
MEVRFLVCEMGLRAMDLERQALRDDVPVEAGGVVTFLNDASGDGAMLFI